MKPKANFLPQMRTQKLNRDHELRPPIRNIRRLPPEDPCHTYNVLSFRIPSHDNVAIVFPTRPTKFRFSLSSAFRTFLAANYFKSVLPNTAIGLENKDPSTRLVRGERFSHFQFFNTVISYLYIIPLWATSL